MTFKHLQIAFLILFTTVSAYADIFGKPGSQFLGTWLKVNGNASNTIKVENNEDQFLVTIDDSHGTARKMGAVYKDGLLLLGPMTPITYIKSSDHITLNDGDAYAEYSRQSPSAALKQKGGDDVQQKNWDQAIVDYSHAIDLDANDAGIYRSRGWAYANKSVYDSAIADYTTALKIDPSNAGAYTLRGQAYQRKGDYDSAVADETAALKINPNNNQSYRLRGSAYQLKGDYDSAIADYNSALKIEPNDQGAKQNLEQLTPLMKVMLVWPKRLLELQHVTPDDNIKTIIQENHLDDANALGKLNDAQKRKLIKSIAMELVQTSKADPVAAELMKEFQITYTPSPAGTQIGQ